MKALHWVLCRIFWLGNRRITRFYSNYSHRWVCDTCGREFDV
jgi:hypothetical protein